MFDKYIKSRMLLKRAALFIYMFERIQSTFVSKKNMYKINIFTNRLAQV